MSNTKVYLAKNILASGFDVEYIKSNLSRIPGIDIVETGMGIAPSKCAAFVIVPDEDSIGNVEDNIVLSQNVYDALNDFLEESEEDYAEGRVYVFTGKMNSNNDYHNPAEQDHPMCLILNDKDIITPDISQAHYAEIDMEDACDDEEELLTCVSQDLNVSSEAWVNNKRHYAQAPQYAMPPIPSIDDRKLKKTATVTAEMRVMDFSAPSKRRLLLRRRNGR